MISSKAKILILLLIILTTTGFKCKQNVKLDPVTLNYWRVNDEESSLKPVLDAYKTGHPYVTINYKQIPLDELENELLNALAEDRGPDIVSLPITWLKKYQSKLVYMPPTTTIAYQHLEGSIKKEIVTEYATNPTMSMRKLKDSFIDTVYEDVVLPTEIINPITKKPETQPKVYGLPLGIDTLAMFYNKDILNKSNISLPPNDWGNFVDAVQKITKKDNTDKLILYGTALGTNNNVSHPVDLVALLMMQNGANMTRGNSVTFNESVTLSRGGRERSPGLESLEFYASFATPSKDVYTWNSEINYDLNIFRQGKLAFMFGYFDDYKVLKKTAPTLKFDVAKIPQITGNPEINFASYYVESVLKKSKHKDQAWDLIQFITSEKEVVKYLELTQRPTALRQLIDSQRESLDIGVFSQQLLTSKNWYRGKNPQKMDLIFREIIEIALKNNTKTLNEALGLGATKINNSY